MKQTKSTSDMLFTAFSAQEDSGEGKVSNIIKADPGMIDKESAQMATKEAEIPIQKIEESQQVRIPGMPQQSSRKPVYQDAVIQEPTSTMAQQSYVKPVKDTSVTINTATSFTPSNSVETQVVYASHSSSNTLVSSLSIDNIYKIIAISDKFRSFDVKVQRSAVQFVGLDSNEQDLAKIIHSVLNIGENKKMGLNDLVSLKKEDRPSRAFSLMGLQDDRLIEVSNLLQLFNHSYKNSFSPQSKIEYCKSIETGIETLDGLALKYLEPVNEILNIQ